VVVVLAALAGWLVLARVTPILAFGETIRLGETATLRAGDRDGAFFEGEWTEVVTTGTVTTRVAHTTRGSLTVPLTRGPEYEGLARIDPAPAPLRADEAVSPLHVLLNGRMIATCDTGSAPDRIGVCRFVIPADAVRDGNNKLTFAGARPTAGLRLWYLRLQRR
jgi:hypothetical protein